MDYQQVVFPYRAQRRPRTRARRRATRWWWSEPGRWVCRWRSTSRCSRCRWCCSTTTIACRPARARSASPSARWRSSIGSAWVERVVDKGVSWSTGRVYLRDAPIFSFNLQPETTHERPAFINIQQYYVEGFLVERAMELPLIDLRWKTRGGRRRRSTTTRVTLQVQTPDGTVALQAEHVVACDGARSSVRQLIGQEAKGRTFKDRFLIADVKMAADFPAERWFWFDPPFHPGQSVLLHKQPDGVWRIDFQLGWDADPEAEKQPERIVPRVRALLAHSAMKDAPFELEWASVYSFSCERMDRFRHGRVLFAGDAAHRVSPFGARGANSGVQDAENLAWKLAAVLQGARRRRAARQLLHRARARGRREHRPLHARHRLHHAQERDQPPVPRRHAAAGARPCRSRARWSTAGGCRPHRRCTARRSTRPTPMPSTGAHGARRAGARRAAALRRARRLAAARAGTAASARCCSPARRRGRRAGAAASGRGPAPLQVLRVAAADASARPAPARWSTAPA